MEVSDITANIKNYPIAWGCGLISLFMGLYIYLSMSSIPDLEIRLDELRRQDSALKHNLREGVSLGEDLNAFKDAFEIVEARLLDRSQIANNNGYFYILAQKNPIELFDVSQNKVISENPKPPAAQIWALKHFCVIPFEMEVVGFLTDIMDFLYELDQCDRFIQIRSYKLVTHRNKEPGYMRLSLRINALGKPKATKKQ